jgi:Trk-type K+ transport system membrane component
LWQAGTTHPGEGTKEGVRMFGVNGGEKKERPPFREQARHFLSRHASFRILHFLYFVCLMICGTVALYVNEGGAHAPIDCLFVATSAMTNAGESK